MEDQAPSVMKWILTSVGTLVGGSVWVGSLQSRVKHNEDDIEDLRKDTKKLPADVAALKATQTVHTQLLQDIHKSIVK